MLHLVDVRLHRCAVFHSGFGATSAARFTGNGGMARRTKARDSLQAMTAPRRSEASPATLEKVLATNRLGNFRIQETAEKSENSAYASSITTAVWVAAQRIFLNSLKPKRVPVGLLGLARKRR